MYHLIPQSELTRGLTVRFIGPESASFGRQVYLANPEDRHDHDDPRWIFGFGAVWPTYVLVYGRSQETAFEVAADWICDHFPGFRCDDAVAEEYRDQIAALALADGVEPTDEQRWEAAEAAEVDMISCDSGNHYLNAAECHDFGRFDRAGLEAFCYPRDVRWGAEDGAIVRHGPTYRPGRADYDPNWDRERPARDRYNAQRAERDQWSEVSDATFVAWRAGLVSDRGFAAIRTAIQG